MTVQPLKQRQVALARLVVRQEVARASDRYFERAREPAERLSAAKLDRHQVLSLKRVACTTDRLSDIYDFLKRQMGRDSELGRKWRQNGGEELLRDLTGLAADARDIEQKVRQRYPEGTDDDTARQVHLMLCREYLKHVTAHYLYSAGGRSP